MKFYESYTQAIQRALAGLEVTNRAGEVITSEQGFELWCGIVMKLKRQNRTCFFIGNGASATMASHMAVDGTKNAGIRAVTFNEPALLTAISNDSSCDDMFALPLKRFAQKGDLLTSISSSGNSPNVLRALDCARDLELGIVTISGMTPSNKSRNFGDLNF